MGEPTERCRCVADMTTIATRNSRYFCENKGQPCGGAPALMKFLVCDFALIRKYAIRCERRTNANDRNFDARDTRAPKNANRSGGGENVSLFFWTFREPKKEQSAFFVAGIWGVVRRRHFYISFFLSSFVEEGKKEYYGIPYE